MVGGTRVGYAKEGAGLQTVPCGAYGGELIAGKGPKRRAVATTLYRPSRKHGGDA